MGKVEEERNIQRQGFPIFRDEGGIVFLDKSRVNVDFF